MEKLKYIALLMMALLVSGSIIIDATPAKGKNYNIAPTIDLNVTPSKKPVDIVILTDYTGTKLTTLNTQINALKAQFSSVSVDPVFQVVSDIKKVGTQNESLHKFRRYGRYNAKISYYSENDEPTRKNKWFEESTLWEETEGLSSQYESLPARNPQNVTFVKSSLQERETDRSYKSWYNITIKTANDVKTSGTVQFEMMYDNWYSGTYRDKQSIIDEYAEVDSKWTMEEKISDVIYDIYSLDFSKLNALPLRTGSDRHMIFISDASAKDYSKSKGNYFSFGDMTASLKNYIENNNFNLYGVVPAETRDRTLHSDKVSKIVPFGNTTLFYMNNSNILQLGDPALSAMLADGTKIYPEKVSDIGGIKDIVITYNATYYLMNSGQVKYASSDTGDIVNVSGISNATKIYYDNSSFIYVLNSSGKIFMVNGTASEAYNNSVAINDIISLRFGTLFLTESGVPYVEYARYDKYYKTYNYRILTRARILNSQTDEIRNMGAVKDGADYYPPNSGYRSNPILILYTSGKVQQFVGTGEERIEDSRYINYIPSFVEDAVYSISETGVDRVESSGISIFVYKTNGMVKVLATDWRQEEDDEDGIYYAPVLRKTLVDVPLTNIQKTYRTFNNKYFLTDGNSVTYLYDTSYMAGNPVIGTTLINMGTEVKDIRELKNNNNLYVYLLYNNGTVRELRYYSTSLLSDKLLPYDNIKNIYGSHNNIYLLSEDGYVYGSGNTSYGQLGYKGYFNGTFVNPFATTLSFDATKTYYSLQDIFKAVPASEFYPTGQYTAAFESIYKTYENFSSAGSKYILLGDEMEYESIYDDYEEDPEYSRRWRISHEPDYYDNSMGMSKFHNPEGFTDSPPVKLDKVGKYKINLKARDNPKNNDSFDGYRLWSLGEQNMTVYIHRKPIALQKVTISDNGNGTFTIIASDAGSYDLDHNNSRADKGIVEREWRWRDSKDMTWYYQQMNKTDCPPDRDYTLQLRVRDVEGVWSDYNTILIDKESPPIAQFDLEKPTIKTDEKLKVTDLSFSQGLSPIVRWNWIVKKLNEDGSLPEENIQNGMFADSNNGTGDMEGFDTNIKTDFEDTGAGTYRIYLRVKNGLGVWSDGGTDSAANLENCFARDVAVEESFKISNFRVVKIKDLHLDSYYYNAATGQYDDKPITVSNMAIDYQNFGGIVDGLTKGYLFEFEIDTSSFNENDDTIVITPHFYTTDLFTRDEDERDLYWENSYHEILKSGEGGHSKWEVVALDVNGRTVTGENTATWRGSYLIPGTAWAVPMGTPPANAKASRINRDIIVNFEIKGYKGGVMKYNYNLQQWPLERTVEKLPYKVGDVIRYSHVKSNLDDNNVIINRP